MTRHKEACTKLTSELDVVSLIRTNRFARFITKMVLKKHQRALINSFKAYQVRNFESPTPKVDALLTGLQDEGTAHGGLADLDLDKLSKA